MAVWDKRILLWGLMYLLTGLYPGAVGNVNYPDPVCAVKGSTLSLPCTFTPPPTVIQDGLKIIRVSWCRNHLICQSITPSVYNSSSENKNNPHYNNPRYKYLGDMKGNCTLHIRDIKKEDDATLRFRMEANDVRGHYTGQSGVKVTVTDGTQMKVNGSRGGGELRGQTVTLYCTADCTFHQLEVSWFRDGHALSQTGPALQLGPLTAKDSGNYTCGLKTNVLTQSLPYSLHVEAGGEGEGGKLPLIVGVASGVLLALLALITAVCIIRRKQAADSDQRALGGELERQEAGQAVEDVSYASIQFQHKTLTRPVEETEDAIVYSSVASRA